jgi:transcriptional regulator with XRE-family HTH domain
MEGTKMLTKTISGKQALALRNRLGVSQRKFWKRLGISQSGGSRYECGRAIPRTVYLLMELAYSDDPEKTFKQVRYRGRSR